MDLNDGLRCVRDTWLTIVEETFECPGHIDEQRTKEFEWGWVICIVPIDDAACHLECKHYCFVYDRVYGATFPVGTKGLSFAVQYIMEARELLKAEANQPGDASGRE